MRPSRKGLWIGLRNYSSARVKEEARRRWVLEQAELLEVLEARVKQLQTDSVSELVTEQVSLSRPEKGSFFQAASHRKVAMTSPARNEPTTKSNERASSQPSRWIEKLNKEKSIKHKRLLRLEAKLERVFLGSGAKPVPKKARVSQGAENIKERPAEEKCKEGTLKSQPLTTPKGRRGSKKITIEGSSIAETSVPSEDSQELEKRIPIWEDAKENLPLEGDDGNQHGNIQLSILSYLDTCLFLRQPERAQQLEMAVKAIRKVVPEFQLPPPQQEAEICTISLLQNFYKKEKPISYPKLDFTAKYLRKQFQKQLAMEASDTITISSRALLAMLRSRWRASLLQSLQESKLRLGLKKTGQLNLYPFFCVLKDEEYVDILMRPDHLLPREYWEKLASEAGCAPSLVSKECAWPHSLLVQLGLHLVELLVQVLKMESNLLTPELEQKLIPVLYHVYSFRSGRQIGFIRPHPILTRLLLEAAETTLTFDSFVIPMLCPPVPWVSPHFGAYIFTPTKLMRYLEGAIQHQLLLDRCPPGNLHPVMDALNQLGNCPWKVNEAILDVVISIFNDKGNEKLDIPPPPSEAPQPSSHFPGSGGPLTKAAFKREVARCRKKAIEMYSLRMDALYKLSIAKHMKGQVFWFPHNMDFRGRTYPCPPHFNHLGSDLTRAILLFAERKPLGHHGLDWLKIHLINLTGLKKRNSLRERLAYANEIMADILDSADHPLTGRKWWMNTDEPWQALACCMEIAKAVRSPDPAAYMSHFPVHQDGSCNGLQHYAALGRDVVGAASVNLAPCDVPQDVYTVVAQQVEVFRKRDAEDGVKIAQVLDGFIGRKVVKQTVMTVVYGEYVWEASHYLVQQVFNSLKEMFSGTREIQLHLILKCCRILDPTF
ncbi:hypothetical protein JD844_034089 [Phrynosoma platyrhinos]|uniref:DNA-directed RNA polymerase n=1 Tax=Phrynosoma platyrhinos TaxID=52577 RepID=A0ABQ7T837_PHRPL|nr:hypothetical protein JD844_034089 [Phrynosoma platyrhinos]